MQVTVDVLLPGEWCERLLDLLYIVVWAAHRNCDALVAMVQAKDLPTEYETYMHGKTARKWKQRI